STRNRSWLLGATMHLLASVIAAAAPPGWVWNPLAPASADAALHRYVRTVPSARPTPRPRLCPEGARWCMGQSPTPTPGPGGIPTRISSAASALGRVYAECELPSWKLPQPTNDDALWAATSCRYVQASGGGNEPAIRAAVAAHAGPDTGLLNNYLNYVPQLT